MTGKESDHGQAQQISHDQMFTKKARIYPDHGQALLIRSLVRSGDRHHEYPD